VGCRQILNIRPDLVIEIDPVPPCGYGGSILATGAVSSIADIQSVEYTMNGRTADRICTNCGEDPRVSAALGELGCHNQVKFTATDTNGNQASTTVAFDCVVEQDSDADGVADCSDCAPDDGAAWSVPGEVDQLDVEHASLHGTSTLSWSIPFDPGGTQLSYTLVARQGPDCVEVETGATPTTVHQETPPPGGLVQFLVQAVNACGCGSLGECTDGTPRAACY
jgi:hypothetical protein